MDGGGGGTISDMAMEESGRIMASISGKLRSPIRLRPYSTAYANWGLAVNSSFTNFGFFWVSDLTFAIMALNASTVYPCTTTGTLYSSLFSGVLNISKLTSSSSPAASILFIFFFSITPSNPTSLSILERVPEDEEDEEDGDGGVTETDGGGDTAEDGASLFNLSSSISTVTLGEDALLSSPLFGAAIFV